VDTSNVTLDKGRRDEKCGSGQVGVETSYVALGMGF
jgi:hypothetical protein